MPKGWSDGVEAVPVPPMPATSGNALTDALAAVKAWAGAYVATDGQLAKANGRTADTIEIVQRCEAAVNAARPGR